jgi:hypothetical protein
MSASSRLVLLVVSLAFFIAHVRTLPGTLEDIDSVNFALGVESFDVAKHQPHPPGYPVYIALGKASTAAVGLVAPSADRDRRAAAGLALWGLVAGTAAAWLFAELWIALGLSPLVATIGGVLAVTSPLFWFTAARPLSDVPGLVAAVAAQALVARGLMQIRASAAAGGARAGMRALLWGALVAGIAVGVRSQAMWLAGPLLLWAAIVLIAARRVRDAAMTVGAGAIGVLLWAVPLVWASGGPRAYLGSLAFQGAQDFEGGHMLFTSPSRRLLEVSLESTFVGTWQSAAVAAVVLSAAAVGAVHLARRRPVILTAVLIGFLPYVVFHLLFQETITLRYGLPSVVPVAGLAAVGLSLLGPRPAGIGVAALVIAGLVIVQPRLEAYARDGAPVFRAFQGMKRALAAAAEPPVLRMHHQVWWGVRRAMEWYRPEWDLGAQPHPGDREWLAVVLHWLTGQTRPVWFLADPTRSDLRQLDGRARSVGGTYSTAPEVRSLIGGARLEALTWQVISRPRWMLAAGWALTPEIAGMTDTDRSGPHRRPAEAFLLRDPRPLHVLIGGRYLAAAGSPPAILTADLDGARLGEWTLTGSPMEFLEWLELPVGVPAGSGAYAQLVVRASSGEPGRPAPAVGLEQFDAATVDEVITAFGEGWYELEGTPETGRLWRWTSDRSVLIVRDGGTDLRLTLAGESPLRYFDRPPTVVVRAGEREIARFSPAADFTQVIELPAAALRASTGRVSIETDLTYVPAERGGTPDRRRLGLRLFRVEVQR